MVPAAELAGNKVLKAQRVFTIGTLMSSMRILRKLIQMSKTRLNSPPIKPARLNSTAQSAVIVPWA